MKTKQQIAQDLRNALNEKDISKREEMITQAENDLYELVKSKEPMEKNEFIQGLYSAAGFLSKGLGQAAKVLPVTGTALQIATPLTEAARKGVRSLNPNANYETPEPNMMAEIESGINVSDRAGFGPLFKDIVTASGGENIGYPIPSDMREEFPQLSSALEEITKPANIASMGLDYILGSKIANKYGPKESTIKPRMVSEKTALGYLRSISKDDKLMLDMLKEKENYKILPPEKRAIAPTPRIDKIVNIIKENPDKYLKIMNPNELFLTLQDDLSKLKDQQDFLVENMPKTAVTDAEDLQRLALSKIKGKEAGRMASAREIVKINIPFKDIDDRVLKSIEKMSELRNEIRSKSRIESSARNQLINELEIEKNSLIDEINNTPEMKNNPNYDKVLNWLGSLESVDNTSDIFPRKYEQNAGEPFFREMDSFLSDRFKGGNVSKDDALNALLDFYKQNQGMYQTNAKGLEGVAFSPRNEKWAGLLKSIKKEKILPLIQGAGKESEMIPNDIKDTLISTAMERISDINSELKDISNKKMKSGRNSAYLKLIDERRALEQNLLNMKRSMLDEFGRIYSEPEDYVQDINKINDVTPQYISKKRQLGNSMKSEYVTLPTIDQKSSMLAGSAIESASSEIQDAIMQSASKSDFDLYKDTNREMSTRIPFRDLVEKNLLDDGGLMHIPAATATGRTGIIESAQKMGPRYIRPTLSKLKYGAGNFLKTPLEAMKYSGELMTIPSYKEKANNIKREPQSLGVALASYEIPRNTAQIMKERDLVLAKLAQETNTPEGQVLFDAIHDALMNNPHKVQGLMKVLSDNYPQIFAQDKYQKFDGIIPVQNRKAALKDLNNSKKYSNGQKADKIQRLINEGYLDEY